MQDKKIMFDFEKFDPKTQKLLNHFKEKASSLGNYELYSLYKKTTNKVYKLAQNLHSQSFKQNVGFTFFLACPVSMGLSLGLLPEGTIKNVVFGLTTVAYLVTGCLTAYQYNKCEKAKEKFEYERAKKNIIENVAEERDIVIPYISDASIYNNSRKHNTKPFTIEDDIDIDDYIDARVKN